MWSQSGGTHCFNHYNHSDGHLETKGCHLGKKSYVDPSDGVSKIAVTGPSTPIAQVSHNHSGPQIDVVNWAIFAGKGKLDIQIGNRKLRAQSIMKHYWTDQRGWASKFVMNWRVERHEHKAQVSHTLQLTGIWNHQRKSKTQKETIPSSVYVANTAWIMLWKKQSNWNKKWKK